MHQSRRLTKGKFSAQCFVGKEKWGFEQQMWVPRNMANPGNLHVKKRKCGLKHEHIGFFRTNYPVTIWSSHHVVRPPPGRHSWLHGQLLPANSSNKFGGRPPKWHLKREKWLEMMGISEYPVWLELGVSSFQTNPSRDSHNRGCVNTMPL